MKKLTMKGFKFLKRNRGRIMASFIATMFTAVPTLAANMDSGDAFKGVMGFVADWTAWLGLAIAFFGVIQLAFGFRSDDAEGKNKGLRSMIAGFVVMAVGLAWTEFELFLGGTPTLHLSR